MSNPYITNSNIYQANAERDISVILSRFNTNYIYDCIENALASRNNVQLNTPNPNLVRSLEDTFIMMQAQYPDDKANILECRDETYIEIINYLCSKFNLTFNNNDNLDAYSTAYYLYDFLVGNYVNYLSKFFAQFIIKEKHTIYKEFNLERFKKTSNINYGKKLFKDNITPTILLQIPYIVDQLMSFDFNLPTIVNIVYDNSNIANYISSVFYDNEYFYNFYRNDVNNQFIRPNIITNIRLLVQNNSVVENAMNNFVKEG